MVEHNRGTSYMFVDFLLLLLFSCFVFSHGFVRFSLCYNTHFDSVLLGPFVVWISFQPIVVHVSFCFSPKRGNLLAICIYPSLSWWVFYGLIYWTWVLHFSASEPYSQWTSILSQSFSAATGEDGHEKFCWWRNFVRSCALKMDWGKRNKTAFVVRCLETLLEPVPCCDTIKCCWKLNGIRELEDVCCRRKVLIYKGNIGKESLKPNGSPKSRGLI